MQSFLAKGWGDCEDHSVLLCNLLIGFGLNAFVCIGMSNQGRYTWVMHKQIPASTPVEPTKTVFWDSLTGVRMEADDNRISRCYKSVSCVFNNKEFYANIQENDNV